MIVICECERREREMGKKTINFKTLNSVILCIWIRGYFGMRRICSKWMWPESGARGRWRKMCAHRRFKEERWNMFYDVERGLRHSQATRLHDVSQWTGCESTSFIFFANNKSCSSISSHLFTDAAQHTLFRLRPHQANERWKRGHAEGESASTKIQFPKQIDCQFSFHQFFPPARLMNLRNATSSIMSQLNCDKWLFSACTGQRYGRTV